MQILEGDSDLRSGRICYSVIFIFMFLFLRVSIIMSPSADEQAAL